MKLFWLLIPFFMLSGFFSPPLFIISLVLEEQMSVLVLEGRIEKKRSNDGRKKNKSREKGIRCGRSNLIFLRENFFSTSWCS